MIICQTKLLLYLWSKKMNPKIYKIYVLSKKDFKIVDLMEKSLSVVNARLQLMDKYVD